MQLHNLTQGTDAWHQHRASHFNASDAPAMMGCSPYKTRSQLLHELHTGLTQEVDAAQQRRFDDGHRYEALARPLAEEFIGQELYPVVGSEGRYSASSDGLTMDETIGFEHKSLNDELRAVFSAMDGVDWNNDAEPGRTLPLQYRVQMEQELIVFGSEKILFMASKWAGEDLIEERHCWYESDPELRASILAGWDQFAADLDAYVPAVVEVKAIGRTPETLPALRIELTGAVTASNLSEFKEHAMAVFAGINRNLTTDQEFADAEKAVKWAKEVEQRLSAAKEHALSQTASIDQLFKTIDDISAEARRMRLELDKLVTNRKEAIRGEIVAAGQDQFRAHIDKLNDSLGRKLMPLIPADFGGVVKGKRTVESLRDAVDTELARVKIEASDIAHRIAQNLRVLESADMDILFPDVATIVLKAPDDFQALVNSRVAEHAAKEAARTVKVDQFVPSAEVAKVLTAFSPPITSDALPITIEAYPVIDTGERMKLGEICTRLGFTVSAEFLSSIGFTPVAAEKNSKLFRACDFPAVCSALIQHIEQVSEMEFA